MYTFELKPTNGKFMCSKCDEFEKTISHYRLLKKQITDRQTNEIADRLMAELELKKLALHPAEVRPPR